MTHKVVNANKGDGLINFGIDVCLMCVLNIWLNSFFFCFADCSTIGSVEECIKIAHVDMAHNLDDREHTSWKSRVFGLRR